MDSVSKLFMLVYSWIKDLEIEGLLMGNNSSKIYKHVIYRQSWKNKFGRVYFREDFFLPLLLLVQRCHANCWFSHAQAHFNQVKSRIKISLTKIYHKLYRLHKYMLIIVRTHK